MRSSTIVIDSRRLGEGSAFRGVGTYVRNLLGALAELDGVEVKALATPGTALPPGVARIPLHRWAGRRLLTMEHDMRLPADLRRSGAAVAHSPALDPPRRSPVPWVQTVHDLIPFAFDDPELALVEDLRDSQHRKYEAILATGKAAVVLAVARTLPQPFRLNDLSVACFTEDPKNFGLKGYPHYPDNHRIHYILYGEKGLIAAGLLTRVAQGTFTVADNAEERLNQLAQG